MSTTIRDLYDDEDCRPYLPSLNTNGVKEGDIVVVLEDDQRYHVYEIVEDPKLECGGYVFVYNNDEAIFFNEITEIYRSGRKIL